MEEIINKIKSNNILIGVAGPGAGKTYTFKKDNRIERIFR